MPVATVKVAYVNPPREGKKQGSIKSEAGEYYAVWPEKLSAFSPGQTYQIEYTESDRGFKSLKRIIDGMDLAGSAPPVGGGSAARAEEMFVMGFLNRCYQGGCAVPPRSQLVAEGHLLRAAWKEIWSAAPKAGVPDPMDDEIPF